MKKLLSPKHTLEMTAAAISAVAFVQVLYQFIFGRHYIIPTMILFVCILFGNLARHGMRGALWAKHMLFWFGVILSGLLFFGIFFAQTPKVVLGQAFLPTFIALFVLFAFLTFQYKRSNQLTL